MSNKLIQYPWQIGKPDNEDESKKRFDRRISLSPNPPTPKFLRRQNEPITPDWDPIISEEQYKGRFRRRKTAPSFERAPSHHKPIFSGSSDLKSSFSSLLEQNKTIVANAPETPPTLPLVINSNFDPILLVQENLVKFIYTYIPQDYSSFVHCSLRRDKSGIQKGFFPTYYLHIKRPGDGNKIFLLAARKIAKLNRQSEYLITTNIETLSEKSGGDGYVGKLRGNNVTNTEYTLYDNGKSPNKYGYKQSHSKNGLRRELAAIVYNNNILSLNGSKQVNAIIPELEHDIQPAMDENTILDQWRNRQFTSLLQLRNSSPKYVDDLETKGHMLQFTGSAIVRRSIKNFQMVLETENHEEKVAMQFGRVDNDTFVCDFRYPLSAIQAFGIALSSFDSGPVRE